MRGDIFVLLIVDMQCYCPLKESPQFSLTILEDQLVVVLVLGRQVIVPVLGPIRVARLGEKSPIGLLKFGFDALLLSGLLFESLATTLLAAGHSVLLL